MSKCKTCDFDPEKWHDAYSRAEVEIERLNARVAELEAAAGTVQFPARGGGTEIYHVAESVKEEAVRDKLIELGWTPPAEANHD